MSETTTEVAKIDNKAVIEYLADTFPEEEKKAITRDLFVVSQIKTISTKVLEEYTDSYGNPKTKWVTVKRKMNVYESLALVMLCRSLNFNPALNLVTMLEDSFYIGLEGHKAYAQSTGLCRGWEAVLVKAEEISYEKKEWAKKKGDPEIITKAKGMKYEYKCTVKKLMPDGKIVEYYGKGVADPSNVAGGDKMTDLKIEQMAEARATRRALGNAFPPGVGHIEDVLENPYYYEPAPQALLPEQMNKMESAEVITMSKPEVVLNTSDFEEAQKPTPPAPKKAPAKTKAPVPTPPPAPMPIPSNSTELPDVEIDEEIITPDISDIEEIASAEVAKPTAKSETESEFNNAPPGIDQINRIADLCKQLGYSERVIDDSVAKLNNRAEAQKAITTLLGKIAEKAGEPKEPKTSSIKKMGEKVEAEYEGIKKTPLEEQQGISEEEASAVFGEDMEYDPVGNKAEVLEYLEGLEENDLRDLLNQHKSEFKLALDAYKLKPTEENGTIKTIQSAWCTCINQTILKKGYGLN